MTDDDRIALDQADALIAEGRLSAACNIARRIVAATPDNWRAGVTLLAAVTAANPALVPAGQALLDRLAPLVRSGRPVWEKDAVRLGRFLLEHREVQAARAIADHQLAQFPLGRHAPIFKYDLEFALGQYDAAFPPIERLIEAGPAEDAPAHRQRLVEGLIKAGRGAQATAVLDALDEPDSARRLANRMAGEIAGGALTAARETGLRLVRDFGSVDKHMRRLTGQLAAAGGEREAIVVLAEAARRAPGDAALWDDLAVLLARGGELAAALEANQAAVAIEPSAPRLYRRGVCEVGLQRLDQAETTLAELARTAPDDAEFHALAAHIQQAKGDGRAALASEKIVANFLRRGGTRRIARQSSLRIVGIIGADGMGDFMYQAMVLATIKRQFSSAHATLIFTNDAPYKDVVLGFMPDLDATVDFANQPYRVDMAGKAPPEYPAHLTFTPATLSPTLLGRFDRTATMRVPQDREDRLRAELVAAGVDPSRWFMVMHYRQGSTFPLQLKSQRDVSPTTFHAMALHVIESLGGQVLRLGHAGMDPIPESPGYVDLSRASIELQVYATARARFMLGTDSGPCGYAAGFRTPILKSNSFSEEGAFYPTDILMPKNVVNWRGEVLNLAQITRHRLLEFKSLEPYGELISFADNTFEQLRYGVELLHAETADIQGWRLAPPARVEPDCPDALAWPPMRRNSRIMPMSELAGRPLWKLD